VKTTDIAPVSAGALAVMKTTNRTAVIIREFHDDLVAASRETPRVARLPASQQQQQPNLTVQRFILDTLSVYAWLLATSRVRLVVVSRRFIAQSSSGRRRLGFIECVVSHTTVVSRIQNTTVFIRT